MPRPTLQAEIRKRRPFDVPEEEAFLNLQRSAAVLGAQAERLLKSHDMTGAQYNVLRILRGAKEGGDWALPCLEIAQRVITPVPDITRLIDRLEAAGLVERRRTGQDRRVVLVSITRSGLDVLKDLDRPLADLHRAQLGHLARRELSMLNRLLVKARINNPARRASDRTA
jgi:DNA-binding MarR family transcriptional regulator